MKRLHLILFLFLALPAIPLFSCNNVINADSFPGDGVNEKSVIIKDVDAENRDSNNGADEQSSVIYFEAPYFNFGKIIKGQKVEHIFKFKNRGNSDLKISKVKSSCGCTAAILTNKIIPSGENGEIKTTFKSGSYNGKVTKSITVKSNDPVSPSYTLTISGEIAEIISVSPKRINFGSVYIGGETNNTVTVTSDSHFEIEKITPSRTFLQASIKAEDENGYTINITSKENHEIGRFSGVISLETDNTLQPKVKIPLFGEITGDITTYPKKLYYGNVKKGNEKTQKVFIKFNKEHMAISGIKITPDFLSAKIVENYKKNSAQFLIEVKLQKNAAVGKLKGLLEINTDSKVQPIIKVPIIGEVI